MAETLVEENIEEKAVKETPKARLERHLREHSVKVFTAEDFNIPQDEETQAKIRAEVDEFLQMREDDRKLSLEREKEREKLWQ
jgi:hypothetical protein